MTARRGRWITVAVAVTTAAVSAAATSGVLALRDRHATTPAAAGPAFTTDPVTRMTLATTGSVDGTLSHGVPEPLESKATGTLTWLPQVGAVLTRGDTLLRADEHPVVLLYGDVPMYRPLTVDTEGDDVEQFERNLRALGFPGPRVDRQYTEATAAAVKRWQKDLGLAATGTVGLPDVVYAAGRIRVASRSARPGGAATGSVLTYTADAKIVTAAIPAREAAWAVAGTKVRVVLPNGRTTGGVVRTLGTDAIAPAPDGGQGDAAPAAADTGATVTVTVTIADQKVIGSIDSGPVEIQHTTTERKNVLTVSVAALVAPIDGGYAVEIVTGETSRLVPVTTGLFADGRVEISGAGIAAGVPVRVPS